MQRKAIAPWKDVFLINVNSIIRFLIVSDIILVGAAGMLAPIFALFIEDFIVGGSAGVAGLAIGIFFFSKSILQIPAAHIIDRINGERDDYQFLFWFTLLMVVGQLLYLGISQPWQLYILQLFLGALTAFTYPSFMAIFTRHVDKGREATEWGVYFTTTDLSSAALAAVGGFIAEIYGFRPLIISMVILSLLGTAALLPIRRYMKVQKPHRLRKTT